jgi:hypothetical protein
MHCSSVRPLLTFVVSSFVLASLCGCSASKASAQASAPVTASKPAPAATQPAAAAPALPPDTLSYTTEKQETVSGIAHKFLWHSSLMLAGELEAKIRDANHIPAKQIWVKKGETLLIPTMESQPVVEHSVPMAKDAEVRAIYLTGTMAGSAMGQEIVQHWREVGGNSVVFDIKDSDGSLSVPFDHALAPKSHHAIPNLPKYVRYLHSMKLHAIARIALFRDENIAQNHSELAVQSRSTGQPWRENGKLVWTDTSNPKVQDYDLDLAKWVAKQGVDEVQFDYVRFPAEGNQADAKFYYQGVHPEWKRADVIADFLSRAYEQLHAEGVLVSLDVFGVMAWQRSVDLSHTGQDIVRMAKFCDVLSPMIYPSHFFGMDGYKDPGDAPEHFIGESLARFDTITTGSGVVLRPWLQAFAWRTKTYSPEYILAQVSTSKSKGGIGFLFWNARNDYAKPYAAMPVMNAHPELYYGKRVAQLETATTTKKAPLEIKKPTQTASDLKKPAQAPATN